MTDAPPPSPADQAATWLHQLYGTFDHGWLTIFAKPPAGTPTTDWAPVNDHQAALAAIAQRAGTCDVWHGVATRHHRLDGGRRGGASDCHALPGLWLDVDVAGPGHHQDATLAATHADARALLDRFPLPPTAVVDSGGGLQAWWLFQEPHEVDGTTTLLLDAWQATWERHGAEAGIHVDNVSDVPRIMRMPGTWNRKLDEARPVRIVEAAWDRRYGVDDIEQHLDEPAAAPAPAAKPIKLAATGTPAAGLSPGDDFNTRHTCGDVLAATGRFTLGRVDRSGNETWVRDGRDPRRDATATVYHSEDGHATIWSDTVPTWWPAVQLRRPYDPFGLHAAIHHGADHAAAARELRAKGYGAPATTSSNTPIALEAQADGAEQPAAPTPADGWPAVEPLDDAPDLPPFPVDVLPVWIRNHVRSVADQNQVAVDMPGSLALGVLSAVLNGHLRIQATEGWVDGVNLWILTLARAGENKSPVLTSMIAPAREHEANLRRFAAASLAEYEQELHALDKRAKDAEEVFAKLDDKDKATQALQYRARMRELAKPAAGEIFASDATMEALVDLLANNGEHGTVADTEGTVLSIVAGRYSNASNVEFMLKSWSGDHHIVRRKTSGTVRMEEPRLAVLLTVQPDRWITVLTNPELRGTGFAERFMVTRVPTKVGRRRHDLRRQALDAAAAITYHDELLAVATQASRWATAPVLRLDPDATELYDELRNDIEGRLAPDDGDLDGHATFTAKMTASVLRAAAILHLAWGNHPADDVDGDTMARAVHLGHYWLAHQLGPIVDAQAIADAGEIVDWAVRTGTTTATALEITRAIHRFRGDNDRRTRALGLLEERGLARSGNQWPLTTARQGVSVVVDFHPHLNRARSEDPREVATQGEGAAETGYGASQPRAPRAETLKGEKQSSSSSEGGLHPLGATNPGKPREPREVGHQAQPAGGTPADTYDDLWPTLEED